MAVCSFANQSRRYDAAYAGRYTGGPFKGVLHTTETSGLPGYGGGASAPHFTVVPNVATKTVTIYQHYDTARPARALLNPDGGVQTNNDSAIQIELVGTCDPAYKSGGKGVFWPAAPSWLLAEVAKLMRWIESKHAIPCKATTRPWLPYPDSAGSRNGQRMTGPEWDGFAGWCGHQHVAENDHGDPGNLNIGFLISWRPVKTTVVSTSTTIVALAAALGVTLTALLTSNPSLPTNPEATVTPGTTVTIPGPAPSPTSTSSGPSPSNPAPSTTSYVLVTAPASSHPLLRKGMAGEAVKVVQRAVGAHVDGVFGQGTHDAVAAFQRAHRLADDGVVGPITWQVVDRVLAARSAPATSTTHPVLRYGARGEAVARAQKLLGVRADGVFGALTLRAVSEFQSAHGLSRDGVIGAHTWAALEARAQALPVLRKGDVSRHVRTVQAAVGAHVDGVFGDETYRKVCAFQRAHGLDDDGVVGKLTWAAIL